jgi:glycosyltransferase involved in cell wall biosynthesis
MATISGSVSLLIPVHENATTVPGQLERLLKNVSSLTRYFEMIIIDDASTDGTTDKLKAFAKGRRHVRLITQTQNRGTAATLRRIYSLARNDYMLLFSIDEEWDPDDITVLLTTLDCGFDIVVGRRRKKAYRWQRLTVSTVHNLLNWMLFGVRTYDAQSIKAFRRVLYQRVPIISQGVFEEAERIIRAKRLGYRVGVVDVAHRRTKKLKNSTPNWPMIGVATCDMVRLWCALFLSRRGAGEK